MCDRYRDDDNTYGYCVYRYAGGMQTRAEMEEACGRAGSWEGDCRHGWVAGRMQPDSGFDTAELLDACGEVPDCTFELIDFRPDPDPVAQIVLCAQHTGPYGRDCAGHAMQRFWLTDPSPEEWARVATSRVPFQDRIGYWLGVEVSCFQKGECLGDGPVRHNCQQTVSDFSRNPARCPLRQKDRVQNNSQNRPGQRPNQPGQNQPGQNQPGAHQPGQNQPGAHQPGQNQPGQNQPGQNQPGQNQPGAHQPGAHQPGAHQPDQNQPGAHQPGQNQPG